MMGHPLELSSLELNHIEEFINNNYSAWNETILFRGYILTKRKSESKYISSIMVITNYHILIFLEGKEMSKKPPKEYHIYDIKELTNKIDFVLLILFQKGKQKSKLKFKSEFHFELLLSVLRKLKHNQNTEHCQGEMVLSFKSNALLASTAPYSNSNNNNNSSSKKNINHTEIFNDVYRGWCSYYQVNPHLPLITLINKMIADGNKEIDLHNDLQQSEFSDMALDMVPFLNALRHDKYFIGLTLRDLKKEAVIKALSEVVLHNQHLKKLSIKRCGSDALHAVFLSLSLNKRNAIQILDVSENPLSSKATTSLVNCMQQFQHALVYLDLSNCSIPAKQLTTLFEAFEKNYGMSLTLEYLNVSHNKFDEQTNYAFSSWIIKSHGYSKLRHLILNSSCISTYSFYALRHLSVLEHLDISNNKLEVGGELDKLLPVLSIPTLHRLDCNHCQLSKEVLALILCKMSDKKASVHIELMGMNLVNCDDNFDMFFNALSLFRDSEISIKIFNLRHLRGTEKTIITLLQILSEIKVNELSLDGLSIVYPQQNGSNNSSINNNSNSNSNNNNISNSNDNIDSPINNLNSGALKQQLDSPIPNNSTPLSNTTGVVNNNRLVFSLATSIDLNNPNEDGDHHPQQHHNNHNNNNSLPNSPTGSNGTMGSDFDGSSMASGSSPHVGEVSAGLSYNQSFNTLFTKSLQKIYMNPELRTLNLSNIGKVTMSLIPCFAKNSSVNSLDISRNSLGDQGASLLASALAANRSILAINIDANAMTNVGWNEILTSLTEMGKTIIKESPNVPLTTSHSRLHSMIYPRSDFEKLIVATDDPVRRVSVYLLISKIQMALIANGNIHYADRKHYLTAKFPIGFTVKKQDVFFPPIPIVLYPRTPIPADIIAHQKLKIDQQRNGNPHPSAISTLAQFLKAPGSKLNKSSITSALNPNNVVIGPPQTVVNNTTSVPKKPIVHHQNNNNNNNQNNQINNIINDKQQQQQQQTNQNINTPIINKPSDNNESPNFSHQPISRSERTSPIPFRIDNNSQCSNENSAVDSPQMHQLPNGGTFSSLPRPKSTAYPSIPSFTRELSSSAGFEPVTHQQIFDAIQSLELATNYCSSLSGYTTPPKSPSKISGTQCTSSKTSTTTTTTSSSSSNSHSSSSSSSYNYNSNGSLRKSQRSSLNLSSSSSSSLSPNSKAIDKSSGSQLTRKPSLSASTSSTTISEDAESDKSSSSSVFNSILNISHHGPYTRVRSQSVIIPPKLEEILSEMENSIGTQSSTSSLESGL